MARKSQLIFIYGLICLLLIGMVILPVSTMIPQANAKKDVLTAKWTGYTDYNSKDNNGKSKFSVDAVGASAIAALDAAAVLDPVNTNWTRTAGTNWEGGVVIGDVTGDGVEDVVFGGNDQLVVLNGTTGSTIAYYSQTRIGQYCQPQLYDVDGDGVLDILVPLYYRPGLAAVQYEGDSTLRLMWLAEVQGLTGSGSVMAKPVAGDIDGDGNLDIFIASQDVSYGNNSTGTYTPNQRNGYDGTICRINKTGSIVAQTFTWRACSGGLSLADTDNDGVFELYQGDRQMGYRDGGYGKGTRSLWADNLTERWNRLDFLSSSQSPVLADVNGDGIKEVLCGMYNEMNILNSTNGDLIQRWSSSSMSVHYGFTVYDIDADGHLELLCSDGDHDDQNYTDVFDLVTGHLDKEIPLGNYNASQPYDEKWGPLVADIVNNGNNDDGSPRMEIITGANTTRTTTYDSNLACILIYDNNYTLLENITGLYGQIGYPFVQDIDNDGLLELVTDSSLGRVYVFDTSMPAPGHNEAVLPGTKRIRSDVTYFGECRLGVAEHTLMPGEADYWTAPLVAPLVPLDNSVAVPVSTTQLHFQIRDDQNESVTYNVTTSPNVGSLSSSIAAGSSYNWNQLAVEVSGLAYDTTYRWTVSASDGSQVTKRIYTFRTELAPNPSNISPGQGVPTLECLDGKNSTTSTYVSSNQSTVDGNNDAVTNIYRWTVNGSSVAQLLLPFDTRNETVAKDYSGFGNDGTVIGATWVSSGKVGGAYSFDGANDAIKISDGGAGYFNDLNYSSNSEELGGFGDWYGVTVEAWIYLTANNYGSRFVAKIPSYSLGFQSNSLNRLTASVWPMQFAISDDDNMASTDREQTVTSSSSLSLYTWYHVAFTYQNGVLRLYVNGAQVAQSSVYTGPIKISRGEPLYIGRLVEPFAGMIDEVKLYSYALPAAQIRNNYLDSRDGGSSSSTYLPTGFTGGGLLSCDVIPTDSYADGGVLSSLSINMTNTPPEASNLTIYPLRDTSSRLVSEDLRASYVYSDPDGDVESGTQIRWYRNGALRSTLNNQLVVKAGNTSIGDMWYFTVLPADTRGEVGNLTTSSSVFIRGNSVPNTGTPSINSTNGGVSYSDEEIIATAAATTDSDGDSTTNIFHWMKGGVSQTNLQMSFDTEIPVVLGTNGAVKDYSGYNNTGVVNGASWVRNGVVGGALTFNGDDFVTVQENGNSLGGSGSWSKISVELWVKAAGTTTSWQTVVFKPDAAYPDSSSATGYRLRYMYSPDGYGVSWIVGTGSLNSFSSQITGNSLVWHHIVCTYKSGEGMKIYTDGELRGTLLASGNIAATVGGLLYLGGVNSGSGDFEGAIDEVRTYPTALSGAQVFQRYVETKDGFTLNSTIVPQETLAGDVWACQVIPNDCWVDGSTRSSANLTLVSGNGMPHIDFYSPVNTMAYLNETDSLDFKQVSSDPYADALSYSWTLDSVQMATAQNWTYTPQIGDSGEHLVRLIVSDGSLTDSQEWAVTVNPTKKSPVLVVRGATDDIFENVYSPDSGLWSGWSQLPGATMDSPAAAVSSGRLYIVARSADGFGLWFGSVALADSSFSGWSLLSGSSPSAPTLTANDTTLCLVVRGQNNVIYYRFYDIASEIWTDWYAFPDGITMDSPSAALLGDTLHIVVRSMDGLGLWYASVDTASSAFSGWIAVEGATPSAPSLVASEDKGELVLAVRGNDDVVYCKTWSGSWSSWVALPSGTTCDTPAIAVVGDYLHVVVRNMSGVSIWQSALNLDTKDFIGWSLVEGSTPSKPTLTS